jgi:FdrA protein
MNMAALVNLVRRTFYMDSVALMRISRTVASLPGVEAAALMIGSTSNKHLMSDAGLLSADGEQAGANDLVLAVRATGADAANAALAEAQQLLDKPATAAGETAQWNPKSIDTALQQLPGANVVLISVPGEFAAAEARKALGKGLHVMMFSDNVPIADEITLKQEAAQRGLLMMGPDCGTAIIGGVPLAFANEIPRGDIGIVAASGTGLQEVSTLIARNGGGVSHAIGVGGRDLKEAVGGLMTLMAIDALDRDAATRRIVLISKPPAKSVAQKILDRVAASSKEFTICFLGLDQLTLPPNAMLAGNLRNAAEQCLPNIRIDWHGAAPSAAELSARIAPDRTMARGLFCGGTLCAEAQIIFRRAGLEVASNVPVDGAGKPGPSSKAHVFLDLGDDEYTVGRPHPMIDPSLRDDMLRKALADRNIGIVLVDIVIGYGAHENPAAELVSQLPAPSQRHAIIVASVCGTDADTQGYTRQKAILEEAGIIVAPSNAHAAEVAVALVRTRQ